MGANTEGFLHVLPTLRTGLRGVVRRDSNELATSILGFVLQQISQCSPGGISNGKREAMVAYHVRGFQIFYGNRLIVLDIVM